VPADAAIFAWHCIGEFLLLAAAWRLASACFESVPARWGAVALLAAVLSVPAAGTALAIMDPYLTARSLSTPAALLAAGCYFANQPRRALAWLVFTALIHPQIAVFAAAFLAIAAFARRAASPAALAIAFPALFQMRPAAGAAREALLSRTYFFVYN
jgi:hypothetical protein